MRPLDLAVVDVFEDAFARLGVSRTQVVKDAGIGNNRAGIIFRKEGPGITMAETEALGLAIDMKASEVIAEAEARLTAGSGAAETASNVYELSSRVRDIPPIPEGLAARRVPLEKRRGYLARHQWDSIGEESQLPPEEWDD